MDKYLEHILEIAPKWVLQHSIYDKSTIVQVVVWCQLATSWCNFDRDLCRHMTSLGHYLLTHAGSNQCAFLCYPIIPAPSMATSKCTNDIIAFRSEKYEIHA